MYCAQAQEMLKIDVIYLTDGRVIKGRIFSREPEKPVKLMDFRGTIYVISEHRISWIGTEYGQIMRSSGWNSYRSSKFSRNIYFTSIIETNALIFKQPYQSFYLLEDTKVKGGLGIHSISGITIHKEHFAGIGAGMNFSFRPNQSGRLLGFPLFADYRYYLFDNAARLTLNLAGGVFVSGNIAQTDNVDYLPYLNPAVGISLPVSTNVSVDITLGYSVYFFHETLITPYGSYYNYYDYYGDLGYLPDYMKHKVWNNYHCINLKIAHIF